MECGTINLNSSVLVQKRTPLPILEVSSPRAVTGGPGGNILVAGGNGPPDKNLTGCCRPWIKFSACEAKKYKNPTEILIFLVIWKIIQFKLLIGSSAGN
jgi:hypothetical protein